MSSRDFGFTTLRNMTAYQPNGAIVPQNYILTTSTNGNAVFTNGLNISTLNVSTINTISINTSTISTTAIYDASGNVGLPGQVLTSDGSEAIWSTISGGSSLPSGTNWADYLYWDNISNSWVVSTDRVRLLQDAGQTGQQVGAVAIGLNAGNTNQNTNAIAIGLGTGTLNQGSSAVAIGIGAGNTTQGIEAIAIGSQSANTSQGTRSIAIGNQAGSSNQGSNAIAIGSNAGLTSQHSNSIILNAQGGTLNSQATSSFYVAPIRNLPNSNVLLYNTTTKEITYNNSIDVSAINVSSINGLAYPPLDDALWSSDGAGNIYNDNSGNVGIRLTAPQYALDVSGTIFTNADLSISTIGSNAAIRMTTDISFSYIQSGSSLANGAANTLLFTPIKSGDAKMAIDLSNGNVGIGLAAPDFKPDFKLDVFGNSLGYGSARITQSTSEFLTIDPALHIKNNSASPYNGIRFFTNLGAGNYNPISDASDKAIVFSDGSENTGNMWIGPWSASEAGIKILTNGNVGIGLQQPQYDLDVNGNIFTNSAFLISTSAANAIRLTTDSSNSYIQSGTSLTPGSRNTLLFTPIDSTTTTMAIDLSNIRVGINTVTPAYELDVNGNIYASGNITAGSDIRFKKDISTLTNSLSTVKGLRGVSYALRNDASKDRKIGLIAQELETVLPEVVFTDESPDHFKSVAYGNIVAVLIEAVKELSNKIENMENILNSR